MPRRVRPETLKVFLDVGGERYLPCEDKYMGAKHIYVQTRIGMMRFDLREVISEWCAPLNEQGAFYALAELVPAVQPD